MLALSAGANAGIIIPAGEWTLDVNGNVNAFMTRTSVDKTQDVRGSALNLQEDGNGEDSNIGMTTGLLPAWLGFTGTTRQNDLDVSFTISFQPSVSDNSYHGDGSNGLLGGATNSTNLNRQTFITFGDKSWGTVKIGKDLGIYASDAILNDMTLLGVGAGGVGAGTSQNTTFGGIGTGYQYAAWKGQISYTTPNMNGFQATFGLMHPGMFGEAATASVDESLNTISRTVVNQDRMGYEAKASYSWTGDVAGKVWVSGASYDVTGANSAAGANGDDVTISAYDIGATITTGNLGLTAYYYDGSGNGITAFGLSGLDVQSSNTKFKKRDGDGGYVQATYVIPTGTKLGASYGVSNLDKASGETNADAGTLVEQQDRWTIGAYHPLTKHLNLVAEYSEVELEAHNGNKNDYDQFSVGAILFF